jgi:hypothetical protein
MGLQTAYTWHIHAGVHPKAATKVQACIPSASATLPIWPNIKTVQQWGIIPPPSRQVSTLSNKDIKHAQLLIGSILYNTHPIDLTILMTLTTIASKQAKGTENTMLKTNQLLNNLVIDPDATVWFHASGMILNVHTNALYLSEANAHSRACEHFFMGWKPESTDPIKLNSIFFSLCVILRFVIPSTAEAELGALFLNCKQATIFRLMLE